MATKDATLCARIDNVKADLRSTSTCSTTTVTALEELLLRKNEEAIEKENVRAKVQATARRRAGTTAAAASVETTKQTSVALTPKEKYILATEVANTTLKTLADALRNPTIALAPRSSKPKPSTSGEARKPSRPRPGHTKGTSVSQKPLKERSVSQLNNSPRKPAPRRSSSYSSLLVSGPDPGLVATAECARIAFGYLGTSEATKVLGKDSQELQYENGVLVLIGKLVALGLDGLAIKEMRGLKRRLDKYLANGTGNSRPESASAKTGSQRNATAEKESLATLLDFVTIDSNSPAIPLVATFQTYTLRVIAKLRRPRIVEAAWEHLQLSTASSPANLIQQLAKAPNGQTKAARQLESLAQTILTLCPSISSVDDTSTLQPSPDIILRLQQLAFVIRRTWWALVKHKGNEQQELFEPFAKCLMAFARRSQLSSTKTYRLAETLYTNLVGEQCTSLSVPNDSGPALAISKTLSTLAQAAGLSDEALRWLGQKTSASSDVSAAKQTARLIRIATVSLEAYLKDDEKSNLGVTVDDALDALKGSLGGFSGDLESLFMEVNALRRMATRLLVTRSSARMEATEHTLIDRQAIGIVAASVHFTARFVGQSIATDADAKAQHRHSERNNMVWKCLKSVIDSVMACCKQAVVSREQWQELDLILQEASHILHRLEEEFGETNSSPEHSVQLSALVVKLSNAYWAISLQLRKARIDDEYLVQAMQRSVSLVHSRSQADQDASHVSMKLEQLGETQENLNRGEGSRKAFENCIRSHLSSDNLHVLSSRAAKYSLQETFSCHGPLAILGRVLKAYHRSFLEFGIRKADEVAFYDDDELQYGVRGALLEWQLMLYLRTRSRNRQWDSSLDQSVISLVDRLQNTYTIEMFPIRRLRLSILLLQLSQTFQSANLSTASPTEEISHSLSSEDEGLFKFGKHLKALRDLKRSMLQTGPPPISIIRQCFTSWECILRSSHSLEALAGHVDNPEDWLQEIQAAVEYLNSKGEEYLALPVLHLIIRVLELQRTSDSSELVIALCTLSLQFLRLGYTGRAGFSFARAEALIETQNTSTEAKLRWHIGYAEYLLAIGNSTKCATVMALARSLALADRQFMDLVKPTTTLSGRVRFNTILADASYIQSLLASGVGSYKEAAQHAKQCVTLHRRIWAALESRANVKRSDPTDEVERGINGSNGETFDPLSSMRTVKGVPLVMSVTHDALSGADFWSLVPALYRSLMQHSQIFAHQGLLHEAIYVAEQAEKVASATCSPTLLTDNASWRADCWAQSGRHDKAEAILIGLAQSSSRKCLSVAGYHSAVARVHHHNGRYEEETACYEVLEQLIDDLTTPAFIKTLESFVPSIDTLSEQLGSINFDESKSQPAKRTTVTRGRKAAVKPAPRAVSKPAIVTRSKPTVAITAKKAPNAKRQVITHTPSESSGIAEQCHVLGVFKASILDRKVLASILQDDLAAALRLLGQAEEAQSGFGRAVSHMWATFKARFAQSVQQIAQDITANTLPESTIAFPAIGLRERRSSDAILAKKPALASSTARGAKVKKQAKESFIDTLRDARERLVEAHSLCALNGSNHLFQQISMALGHITVLLSAVSLTEIHGSLHPLYAAYMSEIPKCNSLRLVQNSVEAEKVQMSRDDCLQWPETMLSSASLCSISDFQREYIDVIPEAWTAISLALNEDRDELYITRYESGLSPFVLRLPLARHASRDLDEEEFTFEDGRRDFDEIIELSDFSTRTAKDMTSREARQQWWTEREALDTRLQELLINMENIWLGGFKGVFSQHERQAKLLARFRKSLETILEQHLPSRSKKSQQKRPVLDARVLELFVGLGDATSEELDLDEALMDLIYFVVDILQFNGERNALDEIDLDAMVVAIHDALRAYHSACQSPNTVSRHTILILDKSLHVFPWESLPCLENLSISRLPSLAALRERLLAARFSRTRENAVPGHYIRTSAGGVSILNPSGDLAHTTKTIKPRLDELQGSWTHITNRVPSEKEFEESLREKELVLYFGHGSGAQYVKSKSVRRLYPGPQCDGEVKPACATTLLFGCSSVHLTENGIYEPSGMLASYLTAGAPAVVGMLWDVTDKDCDRFAIKAGELWGLWPEPHDDTGALKIPAKTPAKKAAKGKGRVAQLVHDVDPVKSVKKGKKTKGTTDDIAQHGEDGYKGVGLDEAVRDARQVCVLRYLNGAAAVVYGIPVYLES